jgi:S1-C subfamily serine protease
VYAVAAVVLLALLAVGVAAALSHATQPSGSQTTVGGAAPTVAVPPSAQDLQQTIINVIQTDQPSVVEVTSQGQGGEAIGSGVVLRPNGYIVTNDHVVSGFSNFAVTLSSGKQDTATLVGEDPQDDLAVLKVNEANLRPINFANSSKVQIGQFAIAMGNPLGLQQSSTFGIVSALDRSASEGQQGPANLLTGLIQTSAPINPGNSGGALVDLQGQLIGIPTLGVQDQQTGGAAAGIGFAIPSNRVKFVTQQLIQHGKLTSTGQGFIGIRGEDVTPSLAAANNLPVQSGVLVAGFVIDASGQSPAQQAGLRVGDIITAVNGQAISGSADLASALISQSPGSSVQLAVVRGSNQPTTISVKLGERPASLQG